MKIYIKYLLLTYLKSFFFITFVSLSLVIIINLLSEIDFFKDLEVNSYFPIFLSTLNSLSFLFEMFPFIFLVSTQLFFINLFSENQINIFKYSGLKNSKIIAIISMLSLILGILIITVFYFFI